MLPYPQGSASHYVARPNAKIAETKHRLKHLWTEANRGRKAPMNLSLADAGQAAELRSFDHKDVEQANAYS